MFPILLLYVERSANEHLKTVWFWEEVHYEIKLCSICSIHSFGILSCYSFPLEFFGIDFQVALEGGSWKFNVQILCSAWSESSIEKNKQTSWKEKILDIPKNKFLFCCIKLHMFGDGGEEGLPINWCYHNFCF